MSSRVEKCKHKSGAQKRKEKKEELVKIQKNTHKIDALFCKKSTSSKQVKDVDNGHSEVQGTSSEAPKTNSDINADSPEPDHSSEPQSSHEPPINPARHEPVKNIPEATPIKSKYFIYKSGVSKEMFWKFHPNQPVKDIPFSSTGVYYRQGIQAMNINRKWVTYNDENRTLHCSFCLMYALEKSRNTQMVQGCSDWRHVTTRLLEHEKSQCHKLSTEAYFMNASEKSIMHSLLREQLSLKRQQVLQRRSVVKCIIDIVFYIGFQALPYRSKHTEAVANVFDEDNLDNHGNFLEAVKLLAEYNPDLHEHLQKVIQKGKQRQPSQKGRGKFVTFLSKTTVTKIFNIIADMIKEEIIKEVKDVGMFSVQIDSTQDVSAHDQCAIVLRYVVGDRAKERLVRLVNVENSSGRSLHTLLSDSLAEIELTLEKCIGDSFDGAPNMSGIYSGLQALMKEACPSHIHTWCYAHVLNLVIGDASRVCVPAVSLFGLLTELSTFFNESYKRMKVWEYQMKTKTGNQKHLRLEHIGQTRWSSRSRALRKLFGSYSDQSAEVFSNLLIILQQVTEATDFKSSVRYEAQKLSENLCKFETLLVAFTFIRIFDITTPVSDYLQTSGLDVIQAWRMIKEAVNKIENISRDFTGIFETTTAFVDHVNERLHEDNLSITKSFSATRSRSATDQTKQFEVSCHNVIMDAILTSIRSRFASHEELYKQISCFDPNRFDEILAAPQNIDLSVIASAVPEIDTVALREELLSFASSYKQLKKGLLDDTDDSADESHNLESDEEKAEVAESCKNCMACAFKLLSQYRLCATAYENLYTAYKFIVTLSITQCTCERCFSKLKLLKTRLRSSLTQNNLESLMLIAVEKEIAMRIKSNKDKVIDKIAKSSAELSSLLLL